jgi:hypothetical protein
MDDKTLNPLKPKEILNGALGDISYNPSLDHIASTFNFVAASIRSISGHGLVKPSAAHFLVASIPILLP